MLRSLSSLCIVVAICALAGCIAGCATPPAAQPSASAAATPAPKPSLGSITHADLQAAAAYATAHGYPARAAMWQAFETQLTAAEAQVAACKAAIAGALPQRSTDGAVGVFTIVEMGAEAVATGVPASVKANCEPIVLPTGLLPLPKL